MTDNKPESSKPKTKYRYVYIDLETDGLDESVDRIAEIGAVVTDEKGTLLSTFQSYVDPHPYKFDFKRPAFVGNGNGAKFQGNRITKNNMILAPYEAEVITSLVKWFDTLSSPSLAFTLRFVFHNASFDVPFLKQAFRRAGKPLDYFRRVLDTVTMGYALTQEHTTLSLERLCEILKVENVIPHSALSDAIAGSNCFHILDKPTNRFLYGYMQPELSKVNPYIP